VTEFRAKLFGDGVLAFITWPSIIGHHFTSVLTMTKFLLNSRISSEAANFGFKSKENYQQLNMEAYYVCGLEYALLTFTRTAPRFMDY
jgi:hypothetical protein